MIALQNLNLLKKNINIFTLSLLSILSFSSSWLLIKKQVMHSGALWPLAVRFFLGSFILYIYSKARGIRLSLSFKKHCALIFQSLLLFSFNFIAIYMAAKYLYSGINSLICASVVIFNVINSAIFNNKKINLSLFFSSVLGLIGLALILSSDFLYIVNSGLDYKGFIFGVGLGVIGAYVTSWGQVFTLKLIEMQIKPVQINIWGMLYGSLVVSICAFLTDSEIGYIFDIENLLSILYMAAIPTAFGFVVYIKLIKEVGADRGGYVFIFVPLVAIIISSIFEDYKWQTVSYLGLGFIIVGKAFPSIRKAYNI
jgi:drug/metabolite transporter (DMT)-like permease